MVLETKMWVRDVLTATGMSPFLGLPNDSDEVHVYILTHIQPHAYTNPPAAMHIY